MYLTSRPRRRLAVTAIAVLISGLAYAAGTYDPATIHRGDGTYYEYTGGGNCSFPLPPSTTYTAAMSASDYANAQICGAWVVVTNPATQQSIRVRIDDQCPECAPGDIDLTRAAFAKISPLAAGRIRVSWRHVAGTASEMKLYFKEGSSRWWTAVQVRDAKYPVRSLGFRAAGSSSAFVGVPRQPYNYFVASNGMGPGPYDIRIVDVHGRAVIVPNVSLKLTTLIGTGKQFATLPTATSAGPATASGTVHSGSPQSASSLVSTSAESMPIEVRITLTPLRSDASGACVEGIASNPHSERREWTATLPVKNRLLWSRGAELEQDDGRIVIRGMEHNRVLPAGASTRFAYCTLP